MSRRISNWNLFSIVNVCLLLVLVATTFPTSSAIRRITRIPTFRGFTNHGFENFPSAFPNAFSIGEHIPGMGRPGAFSIGQRIPRMRRPGRPRTNRIRGFDLQTASSFQKNSYILPPPSFQAKFNPTKPITLSPSSSVMFLAGLPNGYKPLSDVFDEEESISIGKLEAFLIHGDGEKRSHANFQRHLSQPRPRVMQKQRPRHPTKRPIISESLKLLDHAPSTNLIIPFRNLLHDVHKENHHDFKAERKPDVLPPSPNPLNTRYPRQQQRPQDIRGERIRHVPLTPPVSGPKELHIIIHNSPPVQHPPKEAPLYLPARQQNYVPQRKPPLQLQFETGHTQSQDSLQEKYNRQPHQVTLGNSNRPSTGNHIPPRQVANSDIVPQQVPKIPSPQDTRHESTIFTQSSFVSSITPQVPLVPHSPASNPNVQVNTGQSNYALTQPHQQIIYPPVVHQGHSNVQPVQQQTVPGVQLQQQSFSGNQLTQQNVQQNYVSTSQNHQNVLQQNVQMPQNYITVPQNDQRVLQNTQQNYVSTLQNDQRILSQNVRPNYVATSPNDPNALQQNGPPRQPTLVSSPQSTLVSSPQTTLVSSPQSTPLVSSPQSAQVSSSQSIHSPLPQIVQPGHSTPVEYKQAISVQQVNPSHHASTAQYKQGQQTYLPVSQNFGFSSASQPSTSSTQLSQGGIPHNVHGLSQQNGQSSTVPNVRHSYMSASTTGQVSYGSPDETGPTHLPDQRDYRAAAQNVGTRTVTHSVEQQTYTGTAQTSDSEKHASQTFSLGDSASDQKPYPPHSQIGQFYSTTNQQDGTAYVPATRPITFTINPSLQTTAKYIIVNSSGTDNNAGNNVIYSFKSHSPESHATSSSASGYITPGTTYNKESSSGYITPGTTYNKELNGARDPDTSYIRQLSSTSVSSNTFTKSGGGSEVEEFDEEESGNGASYKVVYIPLDILKNFLSKGTTPVNSE